MKTRILAHVLIALIGTTTSFTVFATEGKPKVNKIKNLKVVTDLSAYNKINIGKDLKVVFIDSDSKDLSIESEAKSNGSVKINVVNNVLKIEENVSGKGFKGVIYLPSRDYKEIILGEGATITSKYIMNCNNLIIYLNENSTASIKNRGHLTIAPLDGSKLEYQKFEQINL